MKVVIKKQGGVLIADPVEKPGSPSIGMGKTIEECMGNFLIAYQKELGLEIIVDESAKPAENKRRRDALAQR